MEKTWQQELAELLKENGSYGAVTGKGKCRKSVGTKTNIKRDRTLFRGFHELRALGVRLQSVREFREKHLKILAHSWENKGMSASAIGNGISIFRTFAEWIGKKGMIRESVLYVKDAASVKRAYAATVDKSWSAKGVDLLALIEQISAFDPYVAMQLRVIEAFGLRAEEGVCLRPYCADDGTSLYVTDGTKGGRARTVPVRTDEQRQVLIDARAFVGNRPNKRSLADPNRSLSQAVRRFHYVMEKFGITKDQLGVTAHGLRHEYANDDYELQTGGPSPVRGGQPGEVARADAWLARAKISENLGHVRSKALAAYLGSVYPPKSRI